MKERPILFSGAMVRAILENRKSQTRRRVKPQPKPWALNDAFLEWGDGSPLTLSQLAECGPYGPGMRLWVRETWAPWEGNGSATAWAVYRADAPDIPWTPRRWTPSIFMPRRASRITLEVTDVRVQHVQEISEEDARAEGSYLGELYT